MTTPYDAGNSRTPLRTHSTGIARQLSGIAPQTLQPPPRSVPRQASTNSISTLFTTRDTFGAALKRQKTDSGYVYTTSPVNSQNKLEHSTGPFFDNSSSKVGGTVCSTQSVSKNSTPTTTLSSAPPLPIRPNLSVFRKPRAARLLLATAVEQEVQTKPYTLEVPRIAPQYENHSKS